MALLVDKTLEYMSVVDPYAEVVIQEIATQYETFIDQAINLSMESGNSSLGAKTDAATQRELREKDREIKRLREQVKQNQSGGGMSQGRDVEKEVLRKKVKELEQENRALRTRISN